MQVLHVGLSRFLLTVQAPLMQALQQAGFTDWRLRVAPFHGETDASEALAVRGRRFVLVVAPAQGGLQHHVVEAIDDILDTSVSLYPLVEQVADPTTRVLCWSIGQSLWHLDGSGQLRLDEHDVVMDLRDGGTRSVYGWLTKLLKARYEAEAGPLTVMNCDDFPQNGRLLRQALLPFLLARDEMALAQWVELAVTFPNSVSERLSTGGENGLPVYCESVLRWTLEDDFPAGRPSWNRLAGVQMAPELSPCEQVSFRLLEVIRAMCGWVGVLTGCRYVHEAARHPWLSANVVAYAAHAPDTVSPASRVALARSEELLARCANPALKLPVASACDHGLMTVRRYFAPAIGHALSTGHDLRGVARLPALLFLFLEERLSSNVMVPYEDHVMDPVHIAQLFRGADPLAGFCDLVPVWGKLAGHPGLLSALRYAVGEVRVQLLDDHFEPR